MLRTQSRAEFELEAGSWELLPFRFERMPDQRVLVTNMVGEHLFVRPDELPLIVDRTLDPSSSLFRRLRSLHIVRRIEDDLPLHLLAMKTRTRHRRLLDFTGLHIFVATLRCEHSCPYCQVSRQCADTEQRYDMTRETADRALEATFLSPSRAIKIEFQGGEPLLNFPLIQYVVERANEMNLEHGKNLAFVIATNLAVLDDHILQYCAEHDVHISTSLDGPADLHNRNRPRPGRNSWELATAGIRRIREVLGEDRVSALMTTTEGSLDRAREIVDVYAGLGLREIFFRPLSPYGFAVKTRAHARYDAERWLAFYEEGLDYILELNRNGIEMVERYASIVLTKMLSNEDPGYVDLTSPAGIGIGAIVYNYDGDVYASDEGRMLAEMGDTTFRLGNLHEDSYAEILLSDALLDPLEQSITISAPMCVDCAVEPFCGADPTFHHATTGDFLGRKPDSAFCTRNMGISKLLLDRYDKDPEARELFLSWASR